MTESILGLTLGPNYQIGCYRKMLHKSMHYMKNYFAKISKLDFQRLSSSESTKVRVDKTGDTRSVDQSRSQPGQASQSQSLSRERCVYCHR